MNWDDFDAFCQVVDHGGFTAAARALERPKSSLSASVSRLEEQLGARLLERTTRSLRLTEAGESLYRDISKPFSQLRELAVDAVAKGAQVQGTLRIAAPYEFGAHHLASVACRVMADHPQLKVQIDVEHARVALFERHYDIVFTAVEHSFAPSTVVTRRVYSLERGLFASPAPAGPLPGLASPEDLNAVPLLAGGDDTSWSFTAATAARQRSTCATRRCAAAMRRPRCGCSCSRAPSLLHVPVQAARIGHRVAVHHLLDRLPEQQLLDRQFLLLAGQGARDLGTCRSGRARSAG
jgi:DNA-binding transcriptional LysR family regulator